MQATSAINNTATQRQVRLMGNQFILTVVAEDSDWAEARIDEAIDEMRRIESLLTTFRDDSQTAMINAAAGVAPVAVDDEVFQLIDRSLRISALTQGAFDISYGSIDKSLWNFDTSMTSLPDAEKAREAVRLINWRNIILDAEKKTVFLKEKGMRIGFGGIGKGYAADKAKQLMQAAGVTSGVVNASGDLVTWGNAPGGGPWTVGIASPGESHLPFASMNVSNMAIATSGNYEKFITINGRRYSHTIDPRSGMPVTGIKSVSVICPSAELADALATPVMVMGCRAGLHLINQMKDIACIVIDEDNRLYTSNNIKTV